MIQQRPKNSPNELCDFIENNYSRLVRVASIILPKNASLEPEDLVNRAYVVLSKRDIPPFIKAKQAYIATTMKRLYKDHERKLRELPLDDEVQFSAPAPGLSESKRNRVYELVTQLPPRHEQVIGTHYFQKVKYKDIALAGNETPEAIRGVASRARKKLKHIIEQDDQFNL